MPDLGWRPGEGSVVQGLEWVIGVRGVIWCPRIPALRHSLLWRWLCSLGFLCLRPSIFQDSLHSSRAALICTMSGTDCSAEEMASWPVCKYSAHLIVCENVCGKHPLTDPCAQHLLCLELRRMHSMAISMHPKGGYQMEGKH